MRYLHPFWPANVIILGVMTVVAAAIVFAMLVVVLDGLFNRPDLHNDEHGKERML